MTFIEIGLGLIIIGVILDMIGSVEKDKRRIRKHNRKNK